MADIHINDIAQPERDKYVEVWNDLPDYRKWSPGEDGVARFMEIIKPDADQGLVDIGCGEGKAGLAFAREHGLNVWWLDITDVALDPAVPRMLFWQQPVWKHWGSYAAQYDYGYCVDMMEHVPTEYTMLALDRIFSACHITWLEIYLKADDYGQMIGQPLHLTVQPFIWWRDRIASLGTLMEARDLCDRGLFVVKR